MTTNPETVTNLNRKLFDFAKSLPQDERQLFQSMIKAARQTVSGAEVAGYDGSDHDGLTKINWDALGTLAVPSNPVAERNFGGRQN